MHISPWRNRPPQDPLCAKCHRGEISPDSAAAAADRRKRKREPHVAPLDFFLPPHPNAMPATVREAAAWAPSPSRRENRAAKSRGYPFFCAPWGSVSRTPLLGSWPGRFSHNQFRGNLIFPPLRVGRAGKFTQGVGRHPPQQVAVDIHRGDRRVAVFREAGLVEP